ncbi:MAG: hypothetical protein AAFX56_14055 [Pseudomonadota bacterium]
MQPAGVYRYTSIARPVDPRFPSNKAVLFAVPAAALLAALLSALGLSQSTGVASAALSTALAAFGAWALTRELSPDDDPAAFISMALAVAAQLWLGTASVLPVFVALVLARVVNRSTGMHARWLDSVLVTGFVIWAMSKLADPLLGVAACIAFFLDASLARPARFQLLFGMICLIASMALVVQDGVAMPALADAEGIAFWLGLGILSAFCIRLLTTARLISVGDMSGLPLNTPRVRGGMFVVALAAAQAPVLHGESAMNPLLWACLAGTVTGAVARTLAHRA